MPSTAKSARKRAGGTSRVQHWKENDRLISRVIDSLDGAQKDIAKVGGSLGTGVSDLRRSVNRALKDAQRDAVKMSKATRRDLERIQRDVVAVGKGKGRSSKAAGAAKPSAAKGARAGTAKAAKASSAKASKPSKAKAPKAKAPKARAKAKAPARKTAARSSGTKRASAPR